MHLLRQTSTALVTVVALLLAAPALASVNKSVRVGDGETADGASSVNGSVTVGSNATVTGRLNTVNGTIRVGDSSVIESANTVNGAVRIGDNVQSKSLETVNGAIEVGPGSRVDGFVSAVNGGISLDERAEVSGNVSNINGSIELRGAQAGRNVSTVNGDVELTRQSVILGDLVVEKPRGNRWSKQRKPKLIIGPGSRVDGAIRLEREVRLFISDQASVGSVEGVMSMDDAERFSGERP